MEPEGQKRSSAFTWVVLLFLVVFLAIVFFGSIPAMNNARESGRRTTCQCRARCVSTSLINYENSHHEFPGYSNVLTTGDKQVYVDPKTGKKSGVSWTILIMRQMDRPDLLNAWKTPASKITPTIEAAKHVPLATYFCPSDARVDMGSVGLSYVVNCGMKDWAGSATMPRDWAENGVFFDHFTGDKRVADDKSDQIPIMHSSSAYIARHDGLQNTILMTENVDAGNYTDTDETRVGVLWNPKGTIDASKTPPHLPPPDANMQINVGKDKAHGSADAAVFARPSSNHRGGVNIVFCDSHLNFVSDKIDYYVYCLLMSPDGPRVREPGIDVVIPGFDRPLNDSWIY